MEDHPLVISRGQDDQAIKPELQRFMAKRIGAQTTEIKASQVPFVSHPAEIANLIKAAASGAAEGGRHA